MKLDITIRIVCDEDDIESAMQSALEEIGEVVAFADSVEALPYSSDHETSVARLALSIEEAEE